MLWSAELGREENRRRLEDYIGPALAGFSRLISPCFSPVTLGRVPALTSAWQAHLRSVSAVPMPSFPATAQIARPARGILRPHSGDHPDRELMQLWRVVPHSTSHAPSSSQQMEAPEAGRFSANQVGSIAGLCVGV